MAAPAEITIGDLNGRFVMDKSLSNDFDSILQLQGISWLTRKAIGLATITLHVKEYKEDNDTHIVISQTITGGIQGTQEHRVLNWNERDHTDHIFGHVLSHSRFVKGKTVGDKVLPDVEVQTKTGDEKEDEAVARFLRAEVGPDGKEGEGFLADGETEWVQSWVKSVDNGWTAEQVWGFETINGERRHCRRVVAEKDGKTIKSRLVYQYLGREE